MHRTSMNVVFAIAVATLTVNCSKKTSVVSPPGKNTDCIDANTPAIPQPQKNWRVNATAVQTGDPSLNTELQSLTTGGSPVFEPNINQADAATLNPNFVFQVAPTASGGPVLFTYGGLNSDALYTTSSGNMTVTFESAMETTPGQAPTTGWATVVTQTPNLKFQTFEFTPAAGLWWRVTLTPPTNFNGELDMVELGLYDVGGTEVKDYWVMTGASIEVQSFFNDQFNAAVKAAYPGYDPILVNEAVGGALSTDLLAALPAILARHPHAKYVGIHIGGNDVTNERPYPRGNDTLTSNLQQILQAVVAAGKIPILARLTYRQYPAADPSGDTNVPVPPESNGSGPYVTNTYDPLIKTWSPRFYDCANNRGLVDGYNLTLQNTNYLLPLCTGTNVPAGCDPTGTHLSQSGAAAWQQYWVEVAGAIVYGEQPAQ